MCWSSEKSRTERKTSIFVQRKSLGMRGKLGIREKKRLLWCCHVKDVWEENAIMEWVPWERREGDQAASTLTAVRTAAMS